MSRRRAVRSFLRCAATSNATRFSATRFSATRWRLQRAAVAAVSQRGATGYRAGGRFRGAAC
eukprot:7385284-Prymnesium_polylepis.1